MGVRVRIAGLGFRVRLRGRVIMSKRGEETLIAHRDQDTHRRACAEGILCSVRTANM